MSHYGDLVNASHLGRTPAQRRADALVEMAHRATTAPKDGKRPLPLVNIVCDWDTFQHELATLTGTEGRPVTDNSTCRLLDGEPIAPHDMFHHAPTGEVRRVVFDAAGVTIDTQFPEAATLASSSLPPEPEAVTTHFRLPSSQYTSQTPDRSSSKSSLLSAQTAPTSGPSRVYGRSRVVVYTPPPVRIANSAGSPSGWAGSFSTMMSGWCSLR